MKTSHHKLEGKVAVITGGSSGIGLATARRFIDEGAQVFITGRRQGELDAAVASLGSNVVAVQGDVTHPADLDHLYEVVKQRAGRLDILFANAGFGELASLGSITEEHYDRIFNLNVKGLLFTVEKALPLFTAGGSIILTASTAATTGVPGSSVYSASKAAVRSFARTWMLDVKERKIRVNVLSPGVIDTPLLGETKNDPASADMLKALIASIPLGRIGQPEETANAVLFLASDDSSFVNGTELFVDGGSAQF